MKKLFTTLFVILLTINAFALDIWDGTASPWTQGDGTINNPYLIETAENLAYLAQKVNEGYQAQGQEVFKDTYFLMTDDFDLNNINWTPIGNVNMNMEGYYFGGVFEGWYHNIDHLMIQSNADVCGLFGGAGDKAVIQHLSVTNGNITSTGTGVGGIIGIVAGNAKVYQCSFSGTLSVNNNGSFCGAGGIAAAAAENCIITNCSFSGDITSTNNGGFTTAAGSGGIVAIAMDNASIISCYNTGTLTANALLLKVAAGIVAAVLQENNVIVSNCYNVGTVSAATKGGIFGMVSPINPTKEEASITVDNCYYLNTCGGTTNYGTSMSSDQMKTAQFVEQLNNEIDGVFVMDNGTNNGYPILSLFGFMLYEATDVTAHTAKLSADIHQGYLSLSKVCFYIYKTDLSVNWTVDVGTDGYVEVLLDELEDEADYIFTLDFYHDGYIYTSSELHYFTTEYDGISEISNNSIQIYPNPTSDYIYIENIEPQSVSIYSLDGRLIKTVENVNIIDIRDLDKGMYLININGIIKPFVYI